jgi:serine/threonine-protein kinase
VIGTILSGRYRIEEKCAVGGMGTVYAAEDERLGRRIAVKLLKEELADDPRFIERFRREARSAAALSHPNIAGVYDYGNDGKNHFIVMELVEGNDLGRVLRDDGPLSEERAAAVASQVAAALNHAHAAGVVHRDIKPANILVGPEGRVKVTDFGIARAAGDSTLTATGVMLGTAHYISPEQASGSEIGPASDIYSLGIVLFETLTGAVPFTGDSAVAVAMRHISDPVPPPSSLNPSIDPEFDRIVTKATSKAPADRYASASDMGRDLTSILPTDTAQTIEANVGPGTTAVLPAPTEPGTVWPIPGTKYDPAKLGRTVIAIFIALAVVAGGLLIWRLATKDDGRKRERRASAAAGATNEASESPTELPSEGFIVPEEILGEKYKDVVKSLEALGYVVEVQTFDTQEYDKDVIVDVEPEVGSVVSPGDPITLIVSTGKEPKDEETVEGPGNSENAPGHDENGD